MLEVIVTATPEAAQGRGLINIRSFLESEGLKLERILRGTGDGGQREFHRVLVPEADVERILAALIDDPDVDSAYVSPQNAPPPLSNTNYRSYQTYLNPATTGLGAAYLHTFPGGKGAGIGFIDVENGWNLSHEELAGQVTLAGGFNRPEDAEHGTAVLSIVKGQHTGSGVDGIAPDCTARAYSIYTSSSTSNRAAAIQAAANLLSSGDVLLLEVQAFGPRYNYAAGPQSSQDGCIPVEWFPAEYEAISFATNKGVIVVECAANGYENLDDALYDAKPSGFPSWWVNPFRRTTFDSGAILVGAGYSPVTTQGTTTLNAVRLAFSDYGSCLDVQAWGENVMSAGYGTLYQGAGQNEWYRRDFSGTSAAGALVAGCLVSLAGALKGASKPALTPSSARAVLRATGTAQRAATGLPTTERIGNQINVRQLADYFGLAIPVYVPPKPVPDLREPTDFRLEICNPRGESYSPKRIFDATTQAGIGLDEGVTSIIERGGACKSVVFSGRKDLVAAEDANIVKLTVNDGFGWQPAGFGTLVTAHAAASLESYGNLIRPYEANAEELLKNVITGTESYPPQDVAAIARQLVSKYRHPALSYDETLMPNVGVTLSDPSDFAGVTLLRALGELAKKVEEVNGAIITYGVQADGKVFFKFPSGSFSIPYDEATYRELPIDLKDLCNAVYWVVGNTPDKQGWTGPYEPGMLAYLSIIDPVNYTQNPRIKGLQPSNPETLFKVKNALATSATGFTSASGGAVVQGAKAYRTGTSGTSVYDIINGTLPQYAPFPSGVSFSYRMDFDVIPAAKVELRFELKNVTTGDTVQGRIFYTLPYSDGAYAPFRAVLPPSEELIFDDSNSDLSGTYRFMSEYGFHTARILPPNVGTFRVSNVAFQVLNTAALDAAARYEAKTPAQNPATLESTYERNEVPVGRFVPNVADILHTGRPGGNKTLPHVETRHTFNRKKEYQCFVDVGNPSRDGEDATLERVAAVIENRARESELKLGGRL